MSETTEFWAVEVSRNGEALVTLASTHLSGKPEFTDEEARVIRQAGECLIGFIGRVPTPPPAPEPVRPTEIADILTLIDRHIAKVQITDEGDRYCDGCGELWDSDDHDCVYKFMERIKVALQALTDRDEVARRLIAKWRRKAEHIRGHCLDYDNADDIDACADELEALYPAPVAPGEAKS